MHSEFGRYIREADFAKDQILIRKIRFEVFVKEQKVPANMEMDDRDPHCIHLLVFQEKEPVGTGRIDLEEGGKIGRVAVLSKMRHSHIGTTLMKEFHRIAKERGLDQVWCNAQISAVPFYKRLGYEAVGEYFFEASIEHVRMVRKLE